MGEPLDYVIDDFMTGGQAHKDHYKTQAQHVRGRGAQIGERARGEGRGVRGADFNNPLLRERRRREAERIQKQREKFADYLDNQRRHDALVRGANVDGDRITFVNRETRLSYQNNRGIMNNYENNQYNCDNGVGVACEAVGRTIGDGRNPLLRENQGILFGFAGGSGRTRDYEVVREPQQPQVSGVDDVPSGEAGLMPLQPAEAPATEPVEIIDDTPSDVVVPQPQPPRTGGVIPRPAQPPRKNNDGGGTKDGRDGSASISGVTEMEHLDTGFVDAPLITEPDMMSSVIKFEKLRPNQYDINCRYATKQFKSQVF